MKTQSSSTQAITVGTRPTPKRTGTEHSYTINGAVVTDRLYQGVWVTVKVQ